MVACRIALVALLLPAVGAVLRHAGSIVGAKNADNDVEVRRVAGLLDVEKDLEMDRKKDDTSLHELEAQIVALVHKRDAAKRDESRKDREIAFLQSQIGRRAHTEASAVVAQESQQENKAQAVTSVDAAIASADQVVKQAESSESEVIARRSQEQAASQAASQAAALAASQAAAAAEKRAQEEAAASAAAAATARAEAKKAAARKAAAAEESREQFEVRIRQEAEDKARFKIQAEQAAEARLRAEAEVKVKAKLAAEAKVKAEADAVRQKAEEATNAAANAEAKAAEKKKVGSCRQCRRQFQAVHEGGRWRGSNGRC